MTASVAQIPGICTSDKTDITRQLNKLGAVVHYVTFGARHVFADCLVCNEYDRPANCFVLAGSDYAETCVHCVVAKADDFGARLTGRFDEVTVEIGTVETPAPAVAVLSQGRGDDLAGLPIACGTCAPARGSVASWQIEFERFTKGDIEAIRWEVCGSCLPSCLHAASVQNQGLTPPIVSELPAADLRSAA